jgi:hypothetical protein
MTPLSLDIISVTILSLQALGGRKQDVNAAQVKRNSPIREVTRRVALSRVSFGLLFSLVCAHSIATPITGAARTSIACLSLKHAFEREREPKDSDGSKQEKTNCRDSLKMSPCGLD